MIVMTDFPILISLARNPMVFGFDVTDADGVPYGPKAAKAVAEMELGALQAGETITIDYTEPDGISHSILFGADTAPADAINAFVEDPATLADYQDIAAKMQAHFEIAPYFTIMATEPSPGTFNLTITAIETTDDWTVSWDLSGVSGTTSEIATAAEADNTPDGLELLFDVFIEETYEAGDFKRVADLSERPTSAGRVVFDISHILAAEGMRTLIDPPIPSFSADNVTKADNIRQYYIRYRLNYDDIVASPINPGDNEWYYNTTSKVILGGISQNLFADYNFFGNLSASNSLLTWYPDGKTVGTAQPEFLPFINYTSGDLIVALQVTTTDSDGATATVYKYTDYAITLARWETALIPCGFAQLGLDADAGIAKYTVRVVFKDIEVPENPVLVYSQARTYYVDYDYHLEERYLMYLNGFSVPMTLRCIGNFTNELEVDRQETVKILPPDYSATTAEEKQYAAEYDNYFTYRSGYLPKWEVDALQELPIYNVLYEVYEQGYMPLLVKNNRFPITETRQQLHSMEIVTVPALKARNFSNVSIPLAEETEGWRTSFPSFWKTVFGLTWKIAE